MTNEQILINLFGYESDGHKIIDLSHLKLDGYIVKLNNMKCREIDNSYQRAELINNGYQQAGKIKNWMQKATKEIWNNNQQSEKINNFDQKTDEIIKGV